MLSLKEPLYMIEGKTVEYLACEDLYRTPSEMKDAMKKMLKATNVPEEVWKEFLGEDFWSPYAIN